MGATPAEAIDSSRPVFGRKHELTPFEIARLLVRFNHVSNFVVKTRPKVNRFPEADLPRQTCKILGKTLRIMKTPIPTVRNSMNCAPLRHALLLIPLLLVCLGVLHQAQAVVPPPDGGYANQNTGEGANALFSLTIGDNNTAIGFQTLYKDTTGGGNTALGSQALHSNVAGGANTATGWQALFSNIDGVSNTAMGYQALSTCVHGTENVAVGDFALYSNQGDLNTALGSGALFSNTSGTVNTASGAGALGSNTTGTDNTASGSFALGRNTAAIRNTATGAASLFRNTSGIRNTGTGRGALLNNMSGNNNTADGHDALAFNTTGSLNTALGFNAGISHTTGDNNIYIGHIGAANESNTIRIGTQTAVTDETGAPHAVHTGTFIAGVFGKTSSSGTAVFINSNGKLGTATSSKRFKENIKVMDKASEAIFALKPVTFHYKEEIDPDRTPQFGLVAEDVANVNPDLVVRDAGGKPYTVRYDQVNAMLLNEFLKEHRKVEQQETTITQLKQDFQSRIVEQQKQIQALASGLQQVSAQLGVGKAAPQMVSSHQ